MQGACGHGEIFQSEFTSVPLCPKTRPWFCDAALDETFRLLSLQSPIQESLIDFSDSGMNRVATDIFIGESGGQKGGGCLMCVIRPHLHNTVCFQL